MRYALLGALLIVGGIAAQIEASSHHPAASSPAGYVLPVFTTGWPPTTYDLVRIGGWALLVFGAVIVVFALVRELRRPST